MDVFTHHKALALDASNLKLLYGVQCRKWKSPEKVPIVVSENYSPKERGKCRIKDNMGGEGEDVVNWELSALSLPLQENWTRDLCG